MDHIPSKNLYKGVSINLNPIKVQSCLECNEGFSRDEDYFRNLVSGLLLTDSLTANCLFNTTVSRSLRRSPSLAQKMFSQMSLVNSYSNGGIFLGKKTAVELDYKRIDKILDKYIKGLFFNEFKMILPRNWFIKHVLITNKSIATFMPFLKQLKWKVIQKNIFIFGYNWEPKTFQSIWGLEFFGKLLFYSVVFDPRAVQIK